MALLPSSLAGSRLSISRLFSYAIDWIIILIFAIIGGLFTLVTPVHRVFSLTDMGISYPYTEGTVPFWAAILAALVAPGVIIVLVCLFMVPGSTTPGNTPASVKWKRKIWEINAGWMGLGMALAVSFFITQGMKLMFGRARPDLLARCQPDYQNFSEHLVPGYGVDIPDAARFVRSTICTQTDEFELNDGFQSFPSGHASFSWAGLFYLSLFLCAKFAIAIPWTLPSPKTSLSAYSHSDRYLKMKPEGGAPALPSSRTLRSSAAAPPLWGVVLVIIPPAVAMYITATRWTDYRHHPFDLIIGTLLGVGMAWLSFRWYHAPISSGAGWAWGPRSVGRTWAVGVGRIGYREDAEDQAVSKKNEMDTIERGEGNATSAVGDGDYGNAQADAGQVNGYSRAL